MLNATQRQINALCQQTKPYYTSDRTDKALRLPGTVTVVSVGGYRLQIKHADGILLAIIPKAASAGRGHVILDPWGNKGDRWTMQIGPYTYSQDLMGAVRLHAALTLALDAWIASKGNVDALYAALGQSGHCAICGALLTDELSMSRGIGPECYKKIGAGRAATREVQQRRVEKNTPAFSF